MILSKELIQQHNHEYLDTHKWALDFTMQQPLNNIDEVINKLMAFQIAIPSWALGTGGTRFGRFSGGGEPGNLEQKIEDVGLLPVGVVPCLWQEEKLGARDTVRLQADDPGRIEQIATT